MAVFRPIIVPAAVILFVSAFSPFVAGIKCFQCNSFTDKECVNITVNDTNSPYLKECENHLSEGKPLFCRTIVQHITAFGADDTRVIRKCSYEKSEKECYHFEDDDHSEDVCQCFSDACNRGERRITPGSQWKTIVSVLIATFFSSILATH